MLRQCKITAFFKPKNEENKQKIDNDNCETIVCDEIKKRKYESADFVEEKANKLMKFNSAKRECPFYKMIPQTSFTIDAFSYGTIPNVKYYFLSHFHSDHYYGLSKSFSNTIICTPITKRLIEHQFKIASRLIMTIDINETKSIDGVNVTFLDANHCPGSVIIHFHVQCNGKRYLHTGDFRASPAMQTYTLLTDKPIDHLYLDTTYCDPKYDFPSQNETLKYIVSVCENAFKVNRNILFVCGSYSVGKENVFISIAKALNLNVYAHYNKYKIYRCYDDNTMNSLLVTQPNQSQLHVLPMGNINFNYLRNYIDEYKSKFMELIAFRPTGWEYANCHSLEQIRPLRSNNILIYGIPYSEHSSYSELKTFVQFLKPKRVIPTVNVGNAKNRQIMESYIKSWH